MKSITGLLSIHSKAITTRLGFVKSQDKETLTDVDDAIFVCSSTFRVV